WPKPAVSNPYFIPLFSLLLTPLLLSGCKDTIIFS
ncbi:MAG: hypothetical protein ACJA2S_005513, partial [Cyclobacteriaceae bacterium]